MITAIALLMDKNSRESVHTLALFSSAVLILMLDSFLFSLITGTQVPSEGDRRGICAIAWTQGAVSTGMLAAGATALFGGLGWMLASHAVKKVSEQEAEDAGAYSFLADLGGWLTFAATMTTTLILSETTVDYLHFMFGRRPDLWATGLIVTSAAIFILANFALVYVRTKKLRESFGRQLRADPSRASLDQSRHRNDARPRHRRLLAGRQPCPIPPGLVDRTEHRLRGVRVDTDICAAHDRRDRDL
ncbi:MAG: hypothetical protein ACXWZ2_17900, partial [Mycobacterium sp.]